MSEQPTRRISPLTPRYVNGKAVTRLEFKVDRSIVEALTAELDGDVRAAWKIIRDEYTRVLRDEISVRAFAVDTQDHGDGDDGPVSIELRDVDELANEPDWRVLEVPE